MACTVWSAAVWAASVVDDDACPGGQLVHNGGPDAPRGPGNEHDFVG